MRADLVLDHARLVTVAGGAGPLAGPRQGDLALVSDGALAVREGTICAAGPREDVWRSVEPAAVVDVAGSLVLPGLVDAHTHLVWSGDRGAEFAQRVAGATYLEIMAAGGGIAGTVRATRAATTGELVKGALRRLDRMLAHGTTTVEAKTGYGLAMDEELRHLAVLADAARRHPVRVVPTFLGAHALPDEFRGRQGAYVDLVVEEMLPAVAAAHPGVFCDVFCDEGAFTCAETARILGRARELGLPLKAHSDEFANLGCTALAAGLGAVSVDHLAVTTPAEMDALAASGTVAVLLPGTTFGLGGARYAPARELVARGVPVALGTDYNPGTCMCENLMFMLALATRYLRLSPDEAIVAATRNAACATGVGDRTGRLESGWAADVIVLDADDPRDLSYRFGVNSVRATMIDGRWCGRGAPAGDASPFGATDLGLM